MLVIGLTGPTGAGKGIVSSVFASHGIPVLDADAIYRTLLVPPSQCLDELVNAFGQKILSSDGSLNRKALAAIAFQDHGALQVLNRIAHRHVMESVRKSISKLRKNDLPGVLFDAPQLFEAGGETICDVILSVLAPSDVRKERIMERDRISAEAALARMQAQLPDDFFRDHSHYILENDGSLEHFRSQVENIYRTIFKKEKSV